MRKGILREEEPRMAIQYRNFFGVFTALAVLTVSAQAATVATVNGHAITDADLNALVATLPMHQRDNMLKEPALRNQLIQNLVDQELMVQDATARKVEATKEYRDAISTFHKQALVNILVEKQLTPKVTDAAVKNFFNKNKIRYSSDQVHAEHILLATEKEAQAVMAEVKKPGVDFQKVAESRSKDPTAKNNRGDLGFFGRGEYDQNFVDAAFGGKVGEVVGPVKSPFGYHVIKVVDRKIGKIPEFAEVETKVRNDLQREVLQTYVDGLRRKAKIK
jgi:parvulin-like peptidyl-prolyl isomerase